MLTLPHQPAILQLNENSFLGPNLGLKDHFLIEVSKMTESNQNLKPLFGVYFNSSTIADERVVKNYFSKYGNVFNVKQVSSRVFVNFTSKDDAEQLLLAGTDEKYGEIKKGRFGPKDTRETDSHSVSSLKTPPRNNFSHGNSYTTTSDTDEPPHLVCALHSARIPVKETCDDYPPPLVSACSVSPISPRNYHNSHIRTAYDEYKKHSNLPDVQFSNGIHKRNVSTSPTEEIPPLIDICKPGLSTYITDVHDEPSQYSNQVLIANVPDDTTVGEIEKVLYPLEPIYISDLDVTNVRFKIFFFHVVFRSEKEAITAVKQFDGLQLRGHDLTVKKLVDFLVLTQFSSVT